MSRISTQTVELLDRIYNLRGADSKILLHLEKEMDEAANAYEENSSIRQELENTINKLNNDVEVLCDEGEKLKNILNGINENEYTQLLDTLKIEFHPDEIKEKLESLLPVTVNGLVTDIKMSSNELHRVEEKLQETKTQMEDLNIRKEETLVNQEVLNHYFDLALNSNINSTREEISNLFKKLGFNDEESREGAKLLMFPEDGLFEYETEYKNVPREVETVEEVVPEVVDYSDNFSVEPIEFEEEPIKFIDAEEFENDSIVSEFNNNEEEINHNEIEKISTEEAVEPIIEDNSAEEIVEPIIEENPIEVAEPIIVEDEQPIEIVQEESVKPDKETIINFLNELGFDSLDFTSNDIDKIINNFDENLIRDNINVVKDLGINVDVFADNIELLYDKEMKSKIDKLTGIGKLPQDIYLNPSVLTKYNLVELDSAIKTLEESGLEP